MVKKAQATSILEELHARIKPMLEDGSMLPSQTRFLTWQRDVKAALRNIFPSDKRHLVDFDGLSFVPPTTSYTQKTMTADSVLQALAAPRNYFVRGLTHADAMLSSIINEVKTYWSENGTSENPTGAAPDFKIVKSPDRLPTAEGRHKVFVVHGRNTALRDAMFDFLGSIGLQPIEWNQAREATGEPNPYIGTILDKGLSMAQAVVVLMTPDDEARLKEEFRHSNDPPYEATLSGQARPNVLYEAGMAMGRYPNRTVLVEVGTLRPFTDVAGRHTVRLNDSTATRRELAKRLKTSGCEVDLSGDHWEKAGSFALSGSTKQAQPDNTAKKDSPPLDGEAKEILLALSKNEGNRLTINQLNLMLRWSTTKLKYWLESLEAAQCVRSSVSSGRPTTYTLLFKGREFLVKNKLL
jgi:predicted nucleotide-binding protein